MARDASDTGQPKRPTWVSSSHGLWHVLRSDTTGPWSSAICGRNIQATQRHEGYVAPAAECSRCAEKVKDNA